MTYHEMTGLRQLSAKLSTSHPASATMVDPEQQEDTGTVGAWMAYVIPVAVELLKLDYENGRLEKDIDKLRNELKAADHSQEVMIERMSVQEARLAALETKADVPPQPIQVSNGISVDDLVKISSLFNKAGLTATDFVKMIEALKT